MTDVEETPRSSKEVILWFSVEDCLPEDREAVLGYWPTARHKALRVDSYIFYKSSFDSWWNGRANLPHSERHITYWARARGPGE